MLKLFHCPAACSLAALIALHEAEANFEVVNVDLKTGDQKKPDYLAINPKGKVPALLTDRGLITENPAILAYVAQSFPEARLAPLDDPFEFARMQSFNVFLSGSLQPSWSPIANPDRYVDEAAAHASLKRQALVNAANYFLLVEQKLFTGPYVLGNEYTVADAYLFVFSGVISRLGFNETQYPNILKHREIISQRPAVQRALAAM
jgi:glutathione S-transferase